MNASHAGLARVAARTAYENEIQALWHTAKLLVRGKRDDEAVTGFADGLEFAERTLLLANQVIKRLELAGEENRK